MKRLLPLLLLLLSSASLAETGAYRVEMVVFRNLSTAADSTRVKALRSFSHLPDLEESARQQDNHLPDELYTLNEKSPRMSEVWRNLRSSSTYQPLIYAGWEQNRIDYYPPMRIHDQQIIDSQLRPPTQIMVADLAAYDPLAAYRSTFYRLDGSLQLRRSRFLHLFLDMEFRQEVPQFQIGPDYATETNLSSGSGPNSDNSTEYQLFKLKQNRQIRTGRMQYFDSPNLGVLVYVSVILNK